MQSIKLATIPKSLNKQLDAFVTGALSVINKIPNASGNDPMDIKVEDRPDGKCCIYLLIGKWVGPHEAEFPDVHATK